jgi:hypothetical protein
VTAYGELEANFLPFSPLAMNRTPGRKLAMLVYGTRRKAWCRRQVFRAQARGIAQRRFAKLPRSNGLGFAELEPDWSGGLNNYQTEKLNKSSLKLCKPISPSLREDFHQFI